MDAFTPQRTIKRVQYWPIRALPHPHLILDAARTSGVLRLPPRKGVLMAAWKGTRRPLCPPFRSRRHEESQTKMLLHFLQKHGGESVVSAEAEAGAEAGQGSDALRAKLL